MDTGELLTEPGEILDELRDKRAALTGFSAFRELGVNRKAQLMDWINRTGAELVADASGNLLVINGGYSPARGAGG